VEVHAQAKVNFYANVWGLSVSPTVNPADSSFRLELGQIPTDGGHVGGEPGAKFRDINIATLEQELANPLPASRPPKPVRREFRYHRMTYLDNVNTYVKLIQKTAKHVKHKPRRSH
jgi:hypothetical protein